MERESLGKSSPPAEDSTFARSLPNNAVNASVRLVTPLACASVAPVRPARYRERWAYMKPFALIVLSAVVATSAASSITVQVPRPVAELVLPVLQASAEVALRDVPETEDPLDNALMKVLDDRSQVGNEALAVLLGFYIGEASGEQTTCESIARGKVMLPLLRKYQAAVVVVPGIARSRTRPDKTLYNRVLTEIAAGHGCSWDE